MIKINNHCQIGSLTVSEITQAALIAIPVKFIVRQGQQRELSIGKKRFFNIIRYGTKHVVREKSSQSLIGDCLYRQSISRVGSQNPISHIKITFFA